MDTNFTETEQQFIASGIISAEELDTDYQEYIKNWSSLRREDSALSYEQWQQSIKRFTELSTNYEALNWGTPKADEFWSKNEAEITQLEYKLGF